MITVKKAAAVGLPPGDESGMTESEIENPTDVVIDPLHELGNPWRT